MAEKLDALLASIREGLSGLPEEAVREALDYYTEYIAEALEAGRSEEEILERLGGAAQIVAQVRAEAALARAESRPGPVRLIGARRSVFRGLAGSAARLSLFAGASVPYVVAIGLYLGAVAAFLAVAGAAVATVHEIWRMPVPYALEKLGTAGIGLFAAAMLAAVGIGLWRAAGGITRVTLRLLRRSLRREARPERESGHGRPPRAALRAALGVCLAASLVGVGLTFPSALPSSYVSIWNGMRPSHLVTRSWTFDPEEVREIRASTLNSGIAARIAIGLSDTVRLTYEEPDWMTGAVIREGEVASFRESSSGRLPFLELVARHEGTTNLTIEVPQSYIARAVILSSGSGPISAALPAEQMRVETSSGGIWFVASPYSYGVRASTRNGTIQVRGEPVEGKSYDSGTGLHAAELSSRDGMVVIE